MKIKNVVVKQVEIPLRVRFSQSNNSTWNSSSTIVELETLNGIIGYGETCPRTYVTGETLESVIQSLQLIIPILREESFANFSDLQIFLTEIIQPKVGSAALCGLELALFDAWGKENNQTIIDALGGNHNHLVKYSGVVPAGKTKYYKAILGQLKVFDFDEIKLKVGNDLEDNVEKLRLIKEAFSPNTRLRVDVNTGWNREEALRQIPVLAAEGVDTFEQMFPKGQEAVMGEITREFGSQVRIMADESITTLEEAKQLIDGGLCNHFNLKISKNGGIYQALKIYNLIQESGFSCQLGAHFGETSLLTSAGLTFSSLAPNLTANEGGLGTYLLEKDITSNDLKFNQRAEKSLKHLHESGLGVVVDKSLLESYTIFKQAI